MRRGAINAESERIEAMEEDLAEQPGEEMLGEIHAVKRDLIHPRRAVWPLREVSQSLRPAQRPATPSAALGRPRRR